MANQGLVGMLRSGKLCYPYRGFTKSWNKSLNSSTQSVSSKSCSTDTASLLSSVTCVGGAQAAVSVQADAHSSAEVT